MNPTYILTSNNNLFHYICIEKGWKKQNKNKQEKQKKQKKQQQQQGVGLLVVAVCCLDGSVYL